MLKKGYVKIFLIFVILVIAAFIIRSWTTWIPEPSFANPIHDDWEYLMEWLSALALLLQNIGLALFILSSFLGAVSDRDLSKQVRTGLAIAAGIGIIAIILLGGQMQVIWIV